MKRNLEITRITCALIMLGLIIACIGVTSAVENSGEGKPKGMDLYIDDVPYGSSLGQAVKIGENQVGDFNVIVDDNNPGKTNPTWFDTLGVTPSNTPTATPTLTPTPTATVVIPVDLGGVGAQLCAGDNTSDVIVDFAFSDAGYTNTFKLYSPRDVSLGWSQGTPPNRKTGSTPFGTTWNLGKFSAGQELIFADTANNVMYQTGPASRNGDNFIHGAVSLKNSTGTYHKYLVTFEDFWQGGDKDYNDLEFYVSGNVSTQCTSGGSSGDSGGGAVIPIYVTDSVCKCASPKYNNGKKVTCVAQFTYLNSAGQPYTIPVRESSLPWNEFTGSGMVEQYRCQPTTFYVNASQNSPFWTNRFWNNIKWKLGNEQSVLVKCESNTPQCANSDAVCTECKSNDGSR